MAQNVTVAGASYSAVPSVVLPKTGGGTASFTDVSDTTATASDVASGKYFYTAAGVRTEGTSSGGGGGGGITQDQNGYLVLSPTGGGGGASVTTYSAISNDTIDLDGETASTLFTETAGYGIFARIICLVAGVEQIPFYSCGTDGSEVVFSAYLPDGSGLLFMDCVEGNGMLVSSGFVSDAISGESFVCEFYSDLYYSKIALS